MVQHEDSYTVGDMGYFMGGRDSTHTATVEVYRVCIPSLLSHIISKASSGRDREIWKKIPGLHLTRSTPLSVSGSLLAVGGENGGAVTDIYLYQPDSGGWMNVGDLPSSRYTCTCAMTTDREVLVAGGVDERELMNRVDLALIT